MNEHMNRQIEEILEQEERIIEEKDNSFGFRGGYVTGPRGMWEIHLESLERHPMPDLIALAAKNGYTDVGILKVLHDRFVSVRDAYVSVAREYLAQRQ